MLGDDRLTGATEGVTTRCHGIGRLSGEHEIACG